MHGIELNEATTSAQLDAVRDLMREFLEWNYDRNIEYKALLDRHFDPESFQNKFDTLPGAFAPPAGRIDNGKAAGCVALRDLGDGVCEMKSMFVSPRYQGRGLGRLLGEAIVQQAKEIGYHTMRLDTGRTLVEAQSLYRQLGFKPIDSYYELDPEIRDWLVFMELSLHRPAAANAAP